MAPAVVNRCLGAKRPRGDLGGIHYHGTVTNYQAEVEAKENPMPQVKNIVLVHGAWADGSSWSKVIPLLQAKGLHVAAVQNPLTSIADDVAATNRII